MRPSPRLSFFAVACATGMLVCTVKAMDYPYDFAVTGDSAASGASEIAGWSFNSIGVSSGHANFNAGGDSIVLTDTFAQPITNIQVCYKASRADATRILCIDGFNQTTGEGPDARNFPISTSAWTPVDFAFDPADDIDYVEIWLGGSGSKGTWIIYSITIQTADPPPTIDPIPDQTVGSVNNLEFSFSVPVLTHERINFTVTAENVANPGTPIDPGDAFAYDYRDMDGYCFFHFSPSSIGMTSGQIRFTITGTASGVSASQSFVCTVVQGSLPTPPQVWSPWYSVGSVLAGRTLTEQVPWQEADNDEVTFTVFPTNTCHGTYSIGLHDGLFTFTPTAEDATTDIIYFKVHAEDKDGYDEAVFRVVVFPTRTPLITSITDQTLVYGDTLQIDLVAESTEYDVVHGDYIDDPLISSNITVKAGTTAPEGEYVFADGYLSFTPTTNDIGQTFIFTASATDLDGTTNQDFNVTVGLAAPVLKHCPVDQWTTTSFTADLEAAVPGATSYRLRHIHTEANGTVVTGYVDNATFPCVVSGLDTTNYVYDVQAQRGTTVSSWSNAKSIDLHNYIAPTYAIPMTGAARGVYRQDFNTLITSGSIYWYDARTIPGWYAASSSGSMSDEKITASEGATSETGILSCRVDADNIPNRALGLRAATQWDDFSFGAVFTNKCKYAVTNLTVTFTALQIRRYTTISKLHFSYARSGGFIELITSGLTWTDVEALRFTSPVQGSAAQLYPPATERLSASIPFEGANAIQPGEVIAMRWYLEAKNNYPTLAIDDLEIKWECAWPRQTVIYLQ